MFTLPPTMAAHASLRPPRYTWWRQNELSAARPVYYHTRVDFTRLI